MLNGIKGWLVVGFSFGFKAFDRTCNNLESRSKFNLLFLEPVRTTQVSVSDVGMPQERSIAHVLLIILIYLKYLFHAGDDERRHIKRHLARAFGVCRVFSNNIFSVICTPPTWIMVGT